MQDLARIDDLLAFELGGTDEQLNLAAAGELLAGGRSSNKQSMQLVRELSTKDPVFMRPHEGILRMPGASNVRVFALGPPRDPGLLRLLEPEGGEIFQGEKGAASYFASAARGDSEFGRDAPFELRHSIAWDQAQSNTSSLAFFFQSYFGADGPSWRRIDGDWLHSGGQLALDINRQTNNSSLVWPSSSAEAARCCSLRPTRNGVTGPRGRRATGTTARCSYPPGTCSPVPSCTRWAIKAAITPSAAVRA